MVNKKYHRRLKKINKDHDKRDIIDSIDRPIRDLVIEFNRVGLQTKFSCCGFHYDGEEEPKTHTTNKSYIHFYFKNNNPYLTANFLNIINYATTIGWFCFYFQNGVWEINAKVSDGLANLYDKKDGIETAIHDYESLVIRIYQLTEYIRIYIPSISIINKEGSQCIVEISDGNAQYTKLKEWQIKPKNISYVTYLKGNDIKYTEYSIDSIEKGVVVG